MFNPRTLLLARFALIIAALCYSVLERATNRMLGDEILEPLPLGLRTAMWDRVVALGQRFARGGARLEAGTLPLPRPRPARAGAARARPVRAAGVSSSDDEPATTLPRGFGWFRRLSPHAHGAVVQLQLLLKEPEMAALVAEHPAFGRILRPLCHMLAIAPHPHLLALQTLPVRPRQADLRTPRSQEPRPHEPRPVRSEEQERHAEVFGRTTAFASPRRRRQLKNA